MFLAACGGGGGGEGGGGAGGSATGGNTVGTGGSTTGVGGTTMGTTTPTGGTAGTGGVGGTTVTGGGCAGVEPVLPETACAPGAAVCHAATNACLATKEFAGSPSFDMRIAQLTISKPDAFTAAKNPVVAGVLGKGVTPGLPDCNLNGNGTFSWLLSFDLASTKLRTGTALFADSPALSYTFSAGSVPGGLGTNLPVDPAILNLVFDADGCQFQSVGGGTTIQIFLSGAADSVLLPLVSLAVAGQVSPEHNCIGAYDAAALDPGNQCLPPTFTNAGSIAALIPLAAADEAAVQSLKQTLCVLLTGQNDGDPTMKRCPKDAAGVITAKGDACLATGGPATPDCADALSFKADFAASGVDITN